MLVIKVENGEEAVTELELDFVILGGVAKEDTLESSEDMEHVKVQAVSLAAGPATFVHIMVSTEAFKQAACQAMDLLSEKLDRASGEVKS